VLHTKVINCVDKTYYSVILEQKEQWKCFKLTTCLCRKDTKIVTIFAFKAY